MKSLKSDMAHVEALNGFESACCLICEDIRPLQGAVGLLDWKLNGSLTRLLRDEFYLGKRGEKLLVPASAGFSVSKIFVLGIGPREAMTELSLTRSLELAFEMIQLAKIQSTVLAFSEVKVGLEPMLPTLIERTFREFKVAYFE